MRLLRTTGLALALSAGALVDAAAQSPSLIFTTAAPERTSSEAVPLVSPVVEERGLALWGGTASDFGVGVSASSDQWTIRSIASMATLPIEGHDRPTFQQIEVVRPMFAAGSMSVAGGGGIRQEWDGTRVLIGRLLAGTDVGRGRLQGSLVLERATSSPIRHDAADVVTSLGWSRRIGDRLSVGAEGIGQDLEGFWNPAEADGGAKLLVGPSVHVQSKRGDWAASLTAGPVIHASSIASPVDLSSATYPYGGRHFGMFASASWTPAPRR